MTKNKAYSSPGSFTVLLVITFSDGSTTLPTQGFWLRYQLIEFVLEILIRDIGKELVLKQPYVYGDGDKNQLW